MVFCGKASLSCKNCRIRRIKVCIPRPLWRLFALCPPSAFSRALLAAPPCGPGYYLRRRCIFPGRMLPRVFVPGGPVARPVARSVAVPETQVPFVQRWSAWCHLPARRDTGGVSGLLHTAADAQARVYLGPLRRDKDQPTDMFYSLSSATSLNPNAHNASGPAKNALAIGTSCP